MRTRVAIACGALVVALTAGGCGSGTASPAEAQETAQQLLGPKDVDRYAGGTPARALLAWWRSAQFADTAGFRSSFVPSVASALAAQPRGGDALNYFAGAIRNARPQVLHVSSHDGVATIYTMLVYHDPVGTKRYVTSTVPRAFDLRRVGGRWLLTDDAFVQTSLPGSLRRSS